MNNTIGSLSRVCRIVADSASFSNYNRICALRYSKVATQGKDSGRLIISCKRKEYDLYSNHGLDKFKEMKQASKGWNHNYAKGDYFTIYPNLTDVDEPQVELSELNIDHNLQDRLKSMGITKATYFQSKVFPAIHQRKHTLLAAETGCGKTISYLLPIVQNLHNTISAEMNMPRVLILVPNRELAYQIGKVSEQLCEACDLKTKVIVGGRTKHIMMNPEFDNIDILVGTPGAIGKLVGIGVYKLNLVEFTVLDEADTLLDDSFVERLEMLIRRVPQSQITLVAATLPKKLPAILEPVAQTLTQIKSERLHKPLLTIKQRFLRLPRSARPFQLLAIAKQSKQPIIIFTNRNETCNWLAMFLRENGLDCANINGDMNYAIRIEQWRRFSEGECKILSATDVGSRGLNTVDVTHVVNYDFPFHAADYIHRVGRTGRLGSSPKSEVTNFVCSEQEVKLVQDIEMAVRTNTEIPNVDGNITRIIQRSILRKMRESN